MRIAITLILSLVVMLGAAQAEETTRVPFTTTERGLILVDVHINGQGPFPFLVDTGATSSVIFAPLAERLGLGQTKQRYAIVHGIVESGQHPVSVVDSLQIGEATLSGVEAIVLQSPAVQRTWLGIIGLDYLEEYVFVFRNRRREQTLTLFRHGDMPRNYLTGWRELPVYHDATLKRPYKLLFVPIRVDGKRLDGLIDLGSSTPIMNWAGARRIGFDRMYRRLEEQWLIQGATGEFAPKTIIKDVEIAIGRLTSRGSLLVIDTPALRELNRQDTPFLILNAILFSRSDFAVDVRTPSFRIKSPRTLSPSILTW